MEKKDIWVHPSLRNGQTKIRGARKVRSVAKDLLTRPWNVIWTERPVKSGGQAVHRVKVVIFACRILEYIEEWSWWE